MPNAPDPTARLSASDLGARPLIVAPHPDDEALAPAGTLAAAAAGGAEVRVVYATDGDGYVRGAAALRGSGCVPLLWYPVRALAASDYARLGETRVAEARTALAALGIGEGQATFLGYPDGLLAGLGAAGGPLTGRSGRTASRDGARTPGAPYTRTALVADIAGAISDHSATAVLAPHAADTNPDHRALAAATDAAIASIGWAGLRLAYLTHHYTWPWASTASRGLRPPAAIARSGTWVRVALSPDARAAKSAAMRAHVSQSAIPDLAFFMRAFDRGDEWFDVLARPQETR